MLTVECYSGYTADESPRAFVIGDRRVAVVEILDRWLAPDHRYFKVKGDDGDLYILRHDVASSEWDLTLFQKAVFTPPR